MEEKEERVLAKRCVLQRRYKASGLFFFLRMSVRCFFFSLAWLICQGTKGALTSTPALGSLAKV